MKLRPLIGRSGFYSGIVNQSPIGFPFERAEVGSIKIVKSGVSVPVNTSIPTIDNTTPKVGDTLIASTGAWTNTPTGYAYQWLAAGVAIGGATNQTYAVQAADDSNALSIQVTASNASGAGTSATSDPTSDVTFHAPVNTVAPALSSNGSLVSPLVDDILTVTPGTYTNFPTSRTYLWKTTDGTSGAGTNDQLNFTITNSEVGKFLKCVETAINDGGSTPTDSDVTGQIN